MLGIVQANAEDVLARAWNGREHICIAHGNGNVNREVALGFLHQAIGDPDCLRAEINKVEHGRWQRDTLIRTQPGQIDQQITKNRTKARLGFDRCAVGNKTYVNSSMDQ